jgi:hypothetical protein
MRYEIPIAGQIYAAELRAVIAPMNAFGKVMGALVDRGKMLAMYDGRIAGAKANAEVSEMLADIRESNANGREYAELIRSQTAIQVNMQDALVPIKKLLMQLMIPLANNVEKLTAVAARNAENAAAVAGKGLDLQDRILSNVTPIYMISKMIGGYIAKMSVKDRKEQELAFDQLIKLAGTVTLDAPGKDPAANAAAQEIAFPIFNK